MKTFYNNLKKQKLTQNYFLYISVKLDKIKQLSAINSI